MKRVCRSARISLVALAIVIHGTSVALACSGPGAEKVMSKSQRIGWSLGFIALAIVAVGSRVLLVQKRGKQALRLAVLPVVHPGWWMSAYHGDCGFGLRFWSVVVTLLVGLAVALVLCWPHSNVAKSKKWRWVSSSALIGLLPGVSISSLILWSEAGEIFEKMLLVGCTLCGFTIAGTLIGAARFHSGPRPWYRLNFRLRTLLLLPIMLAPLCIWLLPVLPYEAELSTSPFTFLVVDVETQQPIPNAAIRVIDQRFDPGNSEMQGETALSGPDGRADYSLSANVRGKVGVLGTTETITYNPWLIKVDAAGYEPFLTSLGSGGLIPTKGLTARPLGLTFPPPPSLSIGLKRRVEAEAAEGKSDR